jgi:hypothetical protein
VFDNHSYPKEHGMNDRIPASIAAEHKQLRLTLERAKRESGLLGLRARELAELIEPHFAKEEAFALPPLALLPKLAWGGTDAAMTDVIPIARRLAAELPLMVMEHREIAKSVAGFQSAAEEAHRAEYEQFAESLIAHTVHEEEILYPAAVLVGAYLELRITTERPIELG